MIKKRILTGLQPSGTLHIGNYLGSLKPLVDFTKDSNNDVFLMVADYHALTTVRDGKVLRENIYEIVIQQILLSIHLILMVKVHSNFQERYNQ